MRVCVEWVSCKSSGLVIPREFRDEKEVLKESLTNTINQIVKKYQNRHGRYFIVFHGKFYGDVLRQKIRITDSLPPFMTNQIVFWVCNQRSICEWLWSVGPSKKQIEFNKEGVAYLKTKGVELSV